MEPPGGVPPDRDRQLVLRNQSTALIPVVVTSVPAPTTATAGTLLPTLTPTPSTQAPACVKPTSLSLQPHAVIQAMQQFSPSAAGNNNPAAAPTTGAPVAGSVLATSGSSGNANSTSPALASTATAISATTQAATAFSGSSVGHHHLQHHQHPHQQHPHQKPQPAAVTAPNAAPHHGSISGIGPAPVAGSGSGLLGSGGSGGGNQQQTIEKLSRPMAFDKVSSLILQCIHPGYLIPLRFRWKCWCERCRIRSTVFQCGSRKCF